MIENAPTGRPFFDRWLVLIAACLSAFLVGSNATGVMTALPAIKSDLNLTTLAQQWVMNIYMLSATVLVAIMGRFSDIFGKLNVFMFGLAIFGVGSAIDLVADDFSIFLIGRVGQGVGAACMMSASVALVNVTTEKSKRALALGIWASSVALGLGVGVLIAGALIAVVGWRAVFGVDVFVITVSAVLCARIIRHRLMPPTKRKAIPVDYVGTGLLIVALAPFVYALSNAHIAGWTSAETLSLFAIAAAGTVAFVIRELYAVEPLVYFRFFRYPAYLASTLGIFADGVALIAVVLFFNLFAQAPGGLGLTAFVAGAALLPYSATSFVLSVFLPSLLAKGGMKWPITIGMLLMACGLWLLSQTTADTSYADMWWRLVLVGAGMGLTYPFFPIVGLRALPDEHAGQGSGVINMCFYLGLTISIAAGGTVMGKIRGDAVSQTVSGLSDAPANAMNWVHELAHGSASQGKHALAQFSPTDAAQIEHTLNLAEASAFSGAMMLFMIIALIAAATSFFLLRPQPAKTSADK